MTLIRNTVRIAQSSDPITTNELTVVGGHLRVGPNATAITGGYDVRDAGLVGNGAIDNSPLLRALLPTLPEYATLFFPSGRWRFNSTVAFTEPLRIIGCGMATRLQPGDGLTGPMWDLKDSVAPAKPWQTWYIADLAFDGRARAVAYTALRMAYISQSLVERLLFTAINGCGLDIWTMCRDSRFANLTFRSSGNATAPAMWVHETGVGLQDPINQLDFDGCKFHYSQSRHLILECSRSDSPMRGFVFHHCKFHGGYNLTPNGAEYGAIIQPTPYDVGGVLIRNVRNVYFTDCRFHLSAPGIPLFTLANHPTVTPSTYNLSSVAITGIAGGDAGDDLTVTFNAAASNRLTFTDHRFPPHAMVRPTGSTISGVTVGTDYYIIYVDANTISLASSLNNAIAGTALTIGTTGAVTLAAQNSYITLHGDDTSLVESVAGYGKTVNRGHILGLTTSRKVVSNNPSYVLTDPIHYQGP